MSSLNPTPPGLAPLTDEQSRPLAVEGASVALAAGAGCGKTMVLTARYFDDIDGPGLKPTRFFDGRHWEDAQRRRIAESGDVLPPDAHGAKTLQAILDRAPE